MLMEPSRGRYRHLALMEGLDPENGTGRTMFPMSRRNGTGSPRPRVNRTSTQQSVDSDSDSFLDKKQKLFKCARNKDEAKDKDPKLIEQLNSVLNSFSLFREHCVTCTDHLINYSSEDI